MAAPRIFVSGYYGAQNLGDDLLLIASIAGLRTVFDRPHFLVRDHGQTDEISELGSDVEFTGVETVWTRPGTSKALRFIEYLKAISRIMRTCDWVVFGGGTVFHANRGSRSLLLQTLICMTARLHGARIAALGVGVSGISSPLSRALFRTIIASCDLFLVRDKAAMQQCIGTKARLTSDLAFTLADQLHFPDRDRKNGAQRTVAITVCPQAFDVGSRSAAVETFRKTVQILLSQGHRVIFIGMLRSDLLENDLTFIQSIVEHFEAEHGVEIRTPGPKSEEISRAFHDIDVVVGMRFHALVIAAIFGIPFVGIAHDNKIREISRHFDMQYFSLNELASAALAEAANDAIERDIAPDTLRGCIASAQDNFRLLAAVAS